MKPQLENWGFGDHQGTLSGLLNKMKHNIISLLQDFKIKTAVAQFHFNFKLSRLILLSTRADTTGNLLFISLGTFLFAFDQSAECSLQHLIWFDLLQA